MPFPYVFTFYSYKGGVGRSLAMLNVGYTLAGWGRHVLMVDMDLEAPGLGGMLDRLKELSPKPPRDLVDLLTQALKAPSELPPVFEFLQSVLPEKLAPLKPRLGEAGRLDVLSPDTDRDYTDRLGQLALHNRSRDEIIELSHLLHAYFKRQRFSYRPIGVEDFEDQINTPYDYVLVDSRTGFTEIGGLCVGPMADRLVVLTGLNDRNINGTCDFLREVGIKQEPRPAGEVWDDADPSNRDEIPSLGPKPTIIVATPAPSGEIGLKRDRLAELEARVRIKPLRISYHPLLALRETVFVRDFTDELPASEYEKLASRVTAQVGDDALQILNSLERPGIDTDRFRILRLLSYDADYGIWVSGQIFEDPKTPPRLKRRIAAHLAQDPANRAGGFARWGMALSEEAKDHSSTERDRFYGHSISRFAESLRLDPNNAAVFNNFGNTLSEFAKTKTGEQSDQLFEQSFGKFAEAIRRRPDDAEAFNNWGAALFEFAKTKDGPLADLLFEESFSKYAEAVRFRHDFSAAFNNWGNALSELAKAKTGEQAEQLTKQSFAKFAEANRFRPGHADTLNNWGVALSNLAKRSPFERSGRSADQSIEKYAQAIELPSYNWGTQLLEQAKTTNGPGRLSMLMEAREKLIMGGPDGFFNLACVEALLGNASAAVSHLNAWLAAGHSITRAQLDAERDFDSVRNNPEFIDFVDSFCNS